jgi:acyl carrier protein
MTEPASQETAVDPAVLCEIERLFQQILQVDDAEMDPAASFFELGGTSLQAIALAACLQTRFDLEITAVAILLHPTPAVLASHVAALQARIAEQVAVKQGGLP